MPQWSDEDRDVLDVLSELREQGQLLSYSGGQWYVLNARTGAASPLPPADVAELDRLVEQRKGGGAGEATISEAIQRVIQQTGGRYAWSEAAGWYSGRPEVSPTGGLRQRGSMITGRERESLARQTAAEETRIGAERTAEVAGAAGEETIGTVEAADILQVGPGEVARYAREGRLPATMERGRWRFRRSDVEQFARTRQAEQGAEDEAGGGAGGAGGDGGRGGAGIGGVFGAGRDVIGAAAGGAVAITGAVVGFTQNTIATALTAAGGATGAGVARIGGAVANMVTGGIQAAATGAVAVGGAVVNLLVGGLRLVGTVAAVAIGGAILGLFVGAIAAIGTGIATAVSDVVGVAARSAQEALQGVVTVLQDLTRTGREASQAGFAMRAMGGVAPGQDIQTLLFGRALGADISGMMSSWQMRPEFMGPRFGAVGARYDEEDIPGSMMGAARAIRGMDPLLQYPMAGVVSGGQPEAMMRLVQMPEEQLRAAQDLATEMGATKDMLKNIFGTVEPALNRLSTLFLGIKLNVLSEAAPLIEMAVTGLFDLWKTNKERVFGAIERIPEVVALGFAELWRGVGLIVPKLYDIWDTLVGIYDWVKATILPGAKGAAAGLGIPLPGTESPTGGYALGSPEAQRYEDAKRRTEMVAGAAGFVMEHPWETAAGLGAASLGWKYGVPAVGRAIGARVGIGAAQTAAEAGGQMVLPGMGAPGIGARALGGLARGGPYGAAVAAGIAIPYYGTGVGGERGLAGERASALSLAEQQGEGAPRTSWWEGVKGALGFETATSRYIAGQAALPFARGEEDHITDGAAGAERFAKRQEDWWRNQAREFKQAMIEAQIEAARQKDPLKLEVKVEPSPEFAVLIEQRTAEAQFRALQLAVS